MALSTESRVSCRECGFEIDPSQAHVDAAVDQILETSLKDARKKGSVCPLCGHSQQVPFLHRKTVLLSLLLACLVISITIAINIRNSRQTQRELIAKEAIARMASNSQATRMVGAPITMGKGVRGEMKEDETGWREVDLTIPVQGPNGSATVHVVGGRGTGPWNFTTFEIDFEKQHERLDLVSGRIVEYEPGAYVDVHTQVPRVPEFTGAPVAAARFDGSFPCVFASLIEKKGTPQLGDCFMPTKHDRRMDCFEADLRYGNFVMRQSDLYLSDVFEVPLTRSYRSDAWVAKNGMLAFGRNTNHPYDIAPLGSRNPYTWQMIVLEDSDFLTFDRISKGTGYADAVYQHTETSTRFYKATQRWNGNGWTTKLADGTEIHFPESYNAKNLAQGAPTEIIDQTGNRLELHRDHQRNLKEIVTPHGHWMKFEYDELSRIKRVQDDTGHWAHYEYDSNGMLHSVVLSSGRERHYDYDGVLMTCIIDEKGSLLLRNWYKSKTLIAQQFENGATYSYHYHWAPNGYYAESVTVTLPDGKSVEVQVANTVPEFVRNLRKQ